MILEVLENFLPDKTNSFNTHMHTDILLKKFNLEFFHMNKYFHINANGCGGKDRRIKLQFSSRCDQ